MMNDGVLRRCRFRWRRFGVVQTNSVPKATRPNAYVNRGLVATDPSAPFPFFLLEVEEADAPLAVPVPVEFPLPDVEVGLAAVVGAGVATSKEGEHEYQEQDNEVRIRTPSRLNLERRALCKYLAGVGRADKRERIAICHHKRHICHGKRLQTMDQDNERTR
jgi:hypothetical protein